MNKNITKSDLIDNPTTRVPVCLCLDTSGSMTSQESDETDSFPGAFTKSRIDALNEGINLFYDAVRNDEIASFAVDVSIVTFDSEAKCISDFRCVGEENPPPLLAFGMTALGEGVNLALDLLEKRKGEYKSTGVDYYQPWLVLMTDGEPNGSTEELSRAMARCTQLADAKKLSIFPILIGEETSANILAGFSPKRKPLHLKGIKFKEFFEWLSKSTQAVSRSTPGENVPLDMEGIKDWGTI